MHSYAQTNIQLFNQLCREGYSHSELAPIRNAYELAMRLFTGHFLASGRTQIAHIVGTASILSILHLPVEVVAAGLIHNAYVTGDFGDGRKGISEARRNRVRQAVGMDVEEYVYRFPALQWNSKTIPAIRDGLDTLDLIGRRVLLIRLADQLDHRRDLGGLYYHHSIEGCREHINRNGHLVVEIAGSLGFPALAAELERVFRETVLAEIPVELLDQISRNRSRTIAPKSYRRRISIALRQKLIPKLRVLRSAFLISCLICV